jgi:RHS repeat-associated protein
MSDLDRYKYAYDFNSNRLSKANAVSAAAGVFLDEAYSYDHLNRLKEMQRGNLSGGVITVPASREMDYTLDPTGNWSAYLTKLNGSTDLSQTRTASKANEITAINASIGSVWVTPLYDPAGNMTTMPQPVTPTSSFIATYDAWNRMTSLNTSTGSVATYQYDGRGRRIVKTTTGTGGQTRHFYYTNAWQDIEERVGTSTSRDKQYVWGLRYVDELVCRDDATPQRLYAMQDANFNLTAVCGNTSSGVLERYRFDPYGSRTIMNSSWGVISASAYSWSIGHQGLMHDQESGLVYNRIRYLSSNLGRFLQRDLLYVGGLSLYQYIRSNPGYTLDPFGLVPTTQPSTQPATNNEPWVQDPITGMWGPPLPESYPLLKVPVPAGIPNLSSSLVPGSPPCPCISDISSIQFTPATVNQLNLNPLNFSTNDLTITSPVLNLRDLNLASPVLNTRDLNLGSPVLSGGSSGAPSLLHPVRQSIPLYKTGFYQGLGGDQAQTSLGVGKLGLQVIVNGQFRPDIPFQCFSGYNPIGNKFSVGFQTSFDIGKAEVQTSIGGTYKVGDKNPGFGGEIQIHF